MPRSDEVQTFFTAVYSAVCEIPAGQVTTYGHIAALIGTPQRPRQVGVCLKHLPAPTAAPDGRVPRFHHDNVPWQRVLNAKGQISPRGDGGDGRRRQAEALRAEGVVVTENADGLGGLAVDMRQYGWFPRALPSDREPSDREV